MIFLQLLLDLNIYVNPFSFNMLVEYRLSQVDTPVYYITDRINACTLLSQKTCKLKFVCASKTFELQKNTVVYDNELIRYSSERISARRCGIMFDEFVKVSHLS